METQGEQQLLLQVVGNFLDGEAVLLGNTLPEDDRLDTVLDLLFVELLHFLQVHLGRGVVLLVGTGSQPCPPVVDLKDLVLPGDVDERSAIDLTSLLLGQPHVDVVDLLALLLALGDVDENGHPFLVLDGLAQDHPRHEVPEDVGVGSGVVLFDFPEAVVERQVLVLPLLKLLEDDVLADSGQNAGTK